MSYEHYGRIGDIWKHVPLCNFLKNEKPRKYFETNSAQPYYLLSHSSERDYGVYTIIDNANNSKVLYNSIFYQTLKNYPPNKNKLCQYLGSPGFSLNILKENVKEYIFCDIDSDALEKIYKYAKDFKLDKKVKTIHNDSIKTFYLFKDSFTPDDFIHIDPYLIFEENDEGKTFFDVFIDSVKLGMKTMLWYGYNNNYQKDNYYNVMAKKIKQVNLNNRGCLSIELHLQSIKDEDIIVNPGVVGCGVLVANLSCKSIDDFEMFSDELVTIYKNSIINNKYSGQLVKNKFTL